MLKSLLPVFPRKSPHVAVNVLIRGFFCIQVCAGPVMFAPETVNWLPWREWNQSAVLNTSFRHLGRGGKNVFWASFDTECRHSPTYCDCVFRDHPLLWDNCSQVTVSCRNPHEHQQRPNPPTKPTEFGLFCQHVVFVLFILEAAGGSFSFSLLPADTHLWTGVTTVSL